MTWGAGTTYALAQDAELRAKKKAADEQVARELAAEQRRNRLAASQAILPSSVLATGPTPESFYSTFGGAFGADQMTPEMRAQADLYYQALQGQRAQEAAQKQRWADIQSGYGARRGTAAVQKTLENIGKSAEKNVRDIASKADKIFAGKKGYEFNETTGDKSTTVQGVRVYRKKDGTLLFTDPAFAGTQGETSTIDGYIANLANLRAQQTGAAALAPEFGFGGPSGAQAAPSGTPSQAQAEPLPKDQNGKIDTSKLEAGKSYVTSKGVKTWNGKNLI